MATWTPTTFKIRWAEFAPTPDAVVQAALDEATRRTDERVFGDRYDDAIGLRAAHNLSLSPFGQQARLESDKGTDTYQAERDTLIQERAGGGWAAGQGPLGMLW